MSFSLSSSPLNKKDKDVDTSIQDQLQAAIAAHQGGADYLEIRLQQGESTSISFRGHRLDAVDCNFSLAGGIRACYRGGMEFCDVQWVIRATGPD